jgi:hypothetical protein
MDPGAIDWTRVEANVALFTYLKRIVRKEAVGRQRLGSCSIVVEWLHDATPGTLQRAVAVEEDLALVASAVARVGNLRPGKTGDFHTGLDIDDRLFVKPSSPINDMV